MFQTCSDFVSGTYIDCITPAVAVPTPIKNYLNTSNEEADDQSLKQGYVADSKNNSMYIYIGLVFNDNPNIQFMFQNFTGLNLAPDASKGLLRTVLTTGPKIVQWTGARKYQRGTGVRFSVEVNLQ